MISGDTLNEFFEESDEQIKGLIDSLESSFSDMEGDFFDSYYKVNLKYFKTKDGVKTPEYNYPTDSGFDFYSQDEDYTLKPLQRKLFSTGLAFDIPAGYELQIRTKSGLAINQGLMVLNSPGTVDNGYTDEVKAIIINLSDQDVTVKKGMKICQGILSPVVEGKHVNLVPMPEKANKDRNEKGFGSTGII